MPFKIQAPSEHSSTKLDTTFDLNKDISFLSLFKAFKKTIR